MTSLRRRSISGSTGAGGAGRAAGAAGGSAAGGSAAAGSGDGAGGGTGRGKEPVAERSFGRASAGATTPRIERA